MAAPFGRGSSNTPANTDLERRYSTCIDYLKFRFDISWKEGKRRFAELFEILHVNPGKAADGPGRNGYTDRMDLAPGISLLYGGALTRTGSGQETCLLEMKGSGCREFEERYFSHLYMTDQSLERPSILNQAWTELIEECLSMGGRCTRVDLSTDDFSGEIKVDDIRSKVKAKEYSTSLKRIEETESNGSLENDEKPIVVDDIQSVIDRKTHGYSVTFGSRDKLQLCIYDKRAERMGRGIGVCADSWIRFEVRYMKGNAEKEIVRLAEALRGCYEGEHITGCLASIIDFKESNTFSDKDRFRNKTWSKWKSLLEGAKKPDAFATSPRLMDIVTNGAWMMRSCSRAFGRLVFALDVSLPEIGTAFLLSFLDKVCEEDLMAVNQYRASRGLPEFGNVEGLRKAVFSLDGLQTEFKDSTSDVLLSNIGKKEFGRPGKTRKNDEKSL